MKCESCFFLFLSPLFFITSELYSQSYPDAGLWTTFNIEYSLNTRTSVLVTQECRLKENYSRLNLLYSNLGFEYRILKSFKAALTYRFVNKYQDDNAMSYRHRLMLDLTLKNKFGKLNVSYRHRLQVEGRDLYSSESGRVPEWYSRNKFEVKYDIEKRYTPYVSAEFRYQFYDPRNVESNSTWHRNRYVTGIDYKINDKNKVGLYYLIQHEYNVSLPETQFIIGLEYSLSL